MSAFGNDVKDEVYYAIKELFANGYKISDLLEIVKYAVESKECEEGEWIKMKKILFYCAKCDFEYSGGSEEPCSLCGTVNECCYVREGIK